MVSVFIPEKQVMKSILLALVLIITGVASAQDAKAKGILDKVSAKVKANKSFYVEYSANVKNTANGTNTNVTGKGWVKGDKFFATYGDNTIVCNGLKTWTVLKKSKEVVETASEEDDEESMNPKKLMTLWETGFTYKYDKEETLNGEKVHVINLYPKKAKIANYHTVTVYISKSGNELKKAIMKAKDGTVMTYSLTKFTANASVEDSKFVFDMSKYPGYKKIKG